MEDVAQKDTTRNADPPPDWREFEGTAFAVAERLDEIANGRQRFVNAVMGVLDARDEAGAVDALEVDFLDILPYRLADNPSSKGLDAENRWLDVASTERTCGDDPWWDNRHSAWRDLCALAAELPPRLTWQERMDSDFAAWPAPDPEGLAAWNARGEMPEDVKQGIQEWRKMMINAVCEAAIDDPDATLADRDAAAKALGRKLRFLSPQDCKDVVVPDYLIKKVIGRNHVGCIFGEPGAGKSVLAPYLGYMVAQGKPVFGCRTRAGGVLYCAAEDVSGMQLRVEGMLQVHGPAPGFIVVSGVSDLTDNEQVTELAAFIRKHKPALVIVDTIRLAFPIGDENTSETMGQVIKTARAMATHGCAVALIHHPPKADGSTTPSGHGSFNGALDWSIQVVQADQDKIVRGQMRKNRAGALDDIKVAFSIDRLVLTDRKDSDGDPVDVPTLREVANAPAKAKLPSKTGFVRDNAVALIAAGGGQSVSRQDLRDACLRDDRICSKDDRDARALAFKRHYEAALAARVLRNDGDQVFVGRLSGFPVTNDPENGGNPTTSDDIPT